MFFRYFAIEKPLRSLSQAPHPEPSSGGPDHPAGRARSNDPRRNVMGHHASGTDHRACIICICSGQHPGYGSNCSLQGAFQMVLMLLSAPDIICQRQHFQHDLVPVLPAVYKSSCFFQMSGICTVQPCPVTFSTSTPCFVQAVGSMISNRCVISSEMLVFFSS